MSPARKREAIAEVTAVGLCPVRRACRYLKLGESSFYYRVKKTGEKLKALVRRLIALSWEFPRYGARRIRALLMREGWRVSRKFVQRTRRLEGLGVKAVGRKRCRRGKSTGFPMRATRPNEVWSWDFVHDRTANGGKLRLLTMIDEYTRRCLEIRVARQLNHRDVIAGLHQAIEKHGAPDYIRSDNGSEFIAGALKLELASHPIGTLYIDPGSPWQNGYIESFHQRLRDECLNQELFLSVAEARVLIEAWRNHYNQIHPHSGLNFQSPETFWRKWKQQAKDSVRPLGLTPSLALTPV